MSRIDQLYNANKIRVQILKIAAERFVDVDDIQAHLPDMKKAAIRAVCYDLEKDNYLDVIKYNSQKTFKSMKKYKASGKPFREKSFDDVSREYMESRSNAHVNYRGKYDELIAKNPNLRIIRKTDAPLPENWWGNKKDEPVGIGSSFGIL